MLVFITGASGFVGSAVTRELIKHGHKVLGLARSNDSVKKVEALGATALKGSLDDLSTLTQGARSADAVIHTAFIHDFTSPDHDMARNCRKDLDAIKALADGLRGTNKVLVNTHGLLHQKEPGTLTEEGEKNPGFRADSEYLTKQLAKEGVSTVTIRLSPTVHGQGDYAFIPIMINGAKRTGESIYVDDSYKWPAVSVLDAAVLYRLAVEKPLPKGQVLHAIEDKSHTVKDVAQLIANKLDVPFKAVSKEEAIKRLGFIGLAIGTDLRVSKADTEKLTGWKIEHPGLFEDLEKYYF
jgi:nucleoside-diphosphate-sugar epimerase